MMTKQDKTIKELKKVNHKLKHQYDLLQIRQCALNSSYQRLKEKNEELRALYESEREVKEDYKSKVNKVIEYIEKERRTYEDDEYCFDDMIDDVTPLLDILKGVDKE